MGFESDPRQSLSNKKKPGIDFGETRQFWDEVDLLGIPARTEDELRSVYMGRLEGKHWTAVITSRQERMRIRSVHR